MVLSLQTFLNHFTNSLEASIRNHLKNVFACLAMSAVAAIIGALIQLFTKIMQFRFLSYIGASFFLGLLLVTFDDNNTRVKMRMGYLLGFAMVTGVSIGSFWDKEITIDPSVVVTALIETALVFMLSTSCSLLDQRDKLLYLVNIYIILWIIFTNPLLVIMFGSSMLFQVQLDMYFFCTWGLVLHDTPWMIKRRRRGINDFVTHSLAFLLDCFVIFLRVFIILIQESHKKRRN